MGKKIKQERLIGADEAKELATECLRRGTYRVSGLFFELLQQSSDRIEKQSSNIDKYGLPWSITGVKPKRLPQGTKFVVQSNSTITYIVEQPPQVRTLHFSRMLVDHHYYQEHSIDLDEMFAKDERLKKKRHFHLALPYVIFVINLCLGGDIVCLMYFSNKPFVSMKQPVFQPYLPNIYSDGSLCLPGNVMEYNGAGIDVDLFIKEGKYSEAVDLVIDRIWQATFNVDITECFQKVMDSRIRSLWHWEKNSRKDPSFVLGVKWNKPDLHPQEMIAERVRVIMDDYTECNDKAINVIWRIVVKELEKNNHYADQIKKTIRQIKRDFDSALDREIKSAQYEDTDSATKAKERRRR